MKPLSDSALADLSVGAKITILLGENVRGLQGAFKVNGFKVLLPFPGMSDQDIAELASQTYVVTKNAKDFLELAVPYDFDIIDIESIGFLDTDPSFKNETVQKIRKAIRASKLTQLKGNFLLKVMRDEYSLTRIEV